MDKKRVLLQPAYVIHRRPFRETSLLVDFFCLDHGRIAAVAKGARQGKSRMQALLQPFQPLRISFSGRGEVKTLIGAELGVSDEVAEPEQSRRDIKSTASDETSKPPTEGPEPGARPAGFDRAAPRLSGERLFSGLYLNELLSRLLHNHVEHRQLYGVYAETLAALADTALLERVLRRFELELLAELGYAINLQSDCHRHEAIAADKSYRYLPDVGFEETDAGHEQGEGQGEGQAEAKRIFAGADLLALHRLELENPRVAAAAKRLLRQALEVHLGGRPLRSRDLFAPSRGG